MNHVSLLVVNKCETSGKTARHSFRTIWYLSFLLPPAKLTPYFFLAIRYTKLSTVLQPSVFLSGPPRAHPLKLLKPQTTSDLSATSSFFVSLYREQIICTRTFLSHLKPYGTYQIASAISVDSPQAIPLLILHTSQTASTKLTNSHFTTSSRRQQSRHMRTPHFPSKRHVFLALPQAHL